MTRVLADTYAFVALLDGSPEYDKLLRESDVVTTSLNLVELAHTLMQRGRSQGVDDALRPLAKTCVEPPSIAATAREAAIFRHERNSAGGRVSTVDAWAYATARSLGIPFLTGDEDFRGVPDVKFVKA